MTLRNGRLVLVGLCVLGLPSHLTQSAGAQVPSGPVVTTLVLFAGTPAGLFDSRDWGSVWRAVEPISTTGADQRQPGAVHAILPLGPLVFVGDDLGLVVSEDYGQTWRRRDVAGPVLSIMASRYPVADPTLFVGTSNGLLRSRDAGVHFDPLSLQGTAVTRIEWPGPALVVATGRGVLRSDDGGETFEAPGAGLPGGEARAFALSSFFAADPAMFASVGSEGVLYSADGGRAWRPSGLAGGTVTDLVWLGPYVYAVSDAGLFRSEDAGRMWKPLGEGLEGRRLRRLLFPSAPQSGAEALVATDDGVYRSFDGGHHWQRVGLQGQVVNCVATFPPPAPLPRKRR
jgi:photosystem II stability/assembly factor-like uncharacterized protein